MPRRRRVLTAAGTVVAVTLSGCLEGGDGVAETATTSGSGGGETTTPAADENEDVDEDEDEDEDEGEGEGEGETTTRDSEDGPDEGTTTAGAEPPAETVRFPSRNGDEVTGTVWGDRDRDCAAVFAHGVGYDRSDWEPQASAVAAGGHAALSVDLNHDDRPSNVEALAGAVAYLRDERGIGTVVFVGASAGANAVVKTEADPDVDVAGLFVLAAGRAASAASEIAGRSFFAVGARDSQRFRDTTRTMYENAPDPKRFETLDSAEHAQGIFATDAGEQLQTYIVQFVDEVCSSP